MPYNLNRMLCMAAFALTAQAAGTSQSKACVEIITADDLRRISQSGDYCLANDIDAGSITNFPPIPRLLGTLDGRGHIIRNLTIRRALEKVGLFAEFGGTVRNLGFINAKVTATQKEAKVGILAGETLSGTRILHCHAAGSVHASGGSDDVGASVGGLIGNFVGTMTDCHANVAVSAGDISAVGGLVGVGNGAIADSHASGPVTAGRDSHVGGLVGISFKTTIARSWATGAVRSRGLGVAFFQGTAGGLIGQNFGKVLQSYATGSVDVVGPTGAAMAGGLVGENQRFFDLSGGLILQSFATGAVNVDRSGRGSGGLVGYLYDGTIEQSYATGPIRGRSRAGGLFGDNNNGRIRESLAIGALESTHFDKGGIGPFTLNGRVFDSYWDVQTTGIDTSKGGGIAKTTRQLQARMPNAFDRTVWAITPGVTYPYLNLAGLNFRSLLATTVFNRQVFVFLPIRQFDASQYAAAVAHADRASLATVFTIVARAIGVTRNIADLRNTNIDTFWNDATRRTNWTGPVTEHAELGPLLPIAPGVPIGEANVIGPLRSDQVVIIAGRFDTPGGGTRVHWMLATSFTDNNTGTVTALVANDPWTGRQVLIDPVAKTVATPPGFPLTNFKVDGFRVVQLTSFAADRLVAR